ncbi:helix-turn-helix domain-containing protein [Corallococcus sp. AB030]|nr:helix-turn-helix domain-containing protein [Corallococcus sp. AB030]
MSSVRRKRPQQGVRLTAGQRRLLTGLLRRGGQQGVALRAAALLLSAEGQSATQVGRTLGVTPRAVYAWRRRWRQEGVQALEARAHPGRPSRLTPAAVELLLKDVESNPREQGYAFARWTCARLAAHLQQHAGVSISPDWVGEVLRRHGFAWRRTKLTLKGLADEEQKSARPKAPQLLEKAGLPAGRALRVVVRGRGEVRPIALGALRLAPPRRAPRTAHPGQERARGSGGRGALPDGRFPLRAPAQERHHCSLPRRAGDAGETREADRPPHRAGARQRRLLHQPCFDSRD